MKGHGDEKPWARLSALASFHRAQARKDKAKRGRRSLAAPRPPGGSGPSRGCMQATLPLRKETCQRCVAGAKVTHSATATRGPRSADSSDAETRRAAAGTSRRHSLSYQAQLTRLAQRPRWQPRSSRARAQRRGGIERERAHCGPSHATLQRKRKIGDAHTQTQKLHH
jgi:hypothetical protein